MNGDNNNNNSFVDRIVVTLLELCAKSLSATIADKPIAVDSIFMVPERFRRGKSLLTAVTRNNFALVCLKMLPIQLGLSKLFPTVLAEV